MEDEKFRFDGKKAANQVRPFVIENTKTGGIIEDLMGRQGVAVGKREKASASSVGQARMPSKPEAVKADRRDHALGAMRFGEHRHEEVAAAALLNAGRNNKPALPERLSQLLKVAGASLAAWVVLTAVLIVLIH
jgi:hypothetical protein